MIIFFIVAHKGLQALEERCPRRHYREDPYDRPRLRGRESEWGRIWNGHPIIIKCSVNFFYFEKRILARGWNGIFFIVGRFASFN